MNYYCLIAGLPDIDIEDNKKVFGIIDFKEELRQQLSVCDMQLIDLFYMKFDNKNLLRYLKDKDAEFDKRGNITKEALADGLDITGDKNEVSSYINTFLQEYKNAQGAYTDATSWENRLTELYYQRAMTCSNKFISRWFEFNLNFNNVLSAYTSRKYNIDVDVVGDNDVAESIRTSNLRDFGLTGMIDDMDTFQRLANEEDLFEREKNIDLLKWHWLDEQTFFNYFGVERVFAYLVKLEIIERWIALDPAEGGKIFRELIDGLKKTVVNEM